MDNKTKALLMLAGAAAAGAGVAAYRSFSKSGSSNIKLRKSIVVHRPVAELYKFWRDFENLPQIVEMLESVQTLDGGRSRWTVTTPHGIHFRWNTEVTTDLENERISWRSVDGSMIDTAGHVRFEPAADGRTTRIRMVLEYAPPQGTIGAAVATLLGDGPEVLVEELLARFKQFMETGKVNRKESAA